MACTQEQPSFKKYFLTLHFCGSHSEVAINLERPLMARVRDVILGLSNPIYVVLM